MNVLGSMDVIRASWRTAVSSLLRQSHTDWSGDTTGWRFTAYRRSLLAGRLCQTGAGQAR
jgi:hypothetical protein